MNANAKTTISLYTELLATLSRQDALMVISALGMRQVDDYIQVNPLPMGMDPEETRAIMLALTIIHAIKAVQDVKHAAQSTPLAEDQARDIAAAAIAKAQNKIQ